MSCDDATAGSSDAVLSTFFQSRVAVFECQVADYVSDLGELETIAAGRMRASRQQEFSSGRHCARQAAQSLSLSAAQQLAIADIAVGDHRDPVWPEGVRGSISHDGHQAIAVVSNDPRCVSVGVDLMSFREINRMPDINRLIATRDETENAAKVLRASAPVGEALEQLVRQANEAGVTLRDELNLAACVIFSAKESVFKCLYPCIREWIGLRDAHISLQLSEQVVPVAAEANPQMVVAGARTSSSGSYTVSFKPEISEMAHQLVGSSEQPVVDVEATPKFSDSCADSATTVPVDASVFLGRFLITDQRIISTAELYAGNPA